MKQNAINIDPGILGGTPVFRGTRVPIQCLFDYIEGEEGLYEFLDGFPSVTKEQAIEVLNIAARFVTSPKYINENITR
ncbi:MAG: DUF433 domain-containing protein [Cytophagales bacterium]|nr:DUF433 domain-containing protein [Cytophagales bacterium]